MTEFTYDDERRREILRIFRPVMKPEKDPEQLIQELEDYARYCVSEREKEVSAPERARTIRNELKRLADQIQKQTEERLSPYSIEAANEALSAHSITLAEVSNLLREAGDAQKSRPAHRQRNYAARMFILKCRNIWKNYATRPPPRMTFRPNNRFYRFVREAMPQRVRPPSGRDRTREITGLVRLVLKSAYELEQRGALDRYRVPPM